jgi:hypothetical protein
MTVQEIVNVVLGQPEVEDNEGVDKISEPIVTSTEAINGLENALKYISVPCRNPKKETKVVAKVVATRCRKPFLYVANMVATITKNCDQHL